MGGVGFTKDYPVEKFYRDCKIGKLTNKMVFFWLVFKVTEDVLGWGGGRNSLM